MSYGPGRRAVFSFQIFSTQFSDRQYIIFKSQILVNSFQKIDFRDSFQKLEISKDVFSKFSFIKRFSEIVFRFRCSVFGDAAVELWSWASSIFRPLI